MSRTPKYLRRGHDPERGVEYRVTRDVNLLDGGKLLRVEYRLDTAKRRWWQHFLVMLDDGTTEGCALARLDDLIDHHRERAAR